MMKLLRLLPILFVALFVVGCASQKYASVAEQFKGQSAQQLYQTAETAMQKKNWDDAVKRFEALDALYPFGKYAKLAQMDIIYAYYKKDDLASTIAAADRYIHLYPREQGVDYAYYMKGLAYFEQNKSWVRKIYTVDPALRDLSAFKSAFDTFSELVELFPNSKYVPDATRRMVYIKNMLARYQLSVAKFYFEHKAYVAAANRASDVVDHYEGTPQVIDALKIMVKSYRNLGATKDANDAYQVLLKNYPDAARKL